MIPKSTPESAYIGPDINYPIITDAEIPRDEYPRETILKIPPNITITLGKEFAPKLVLDPDFTEINLQEALKAGSDPVSAQIVYGARSNERWEMFLRDFDPLNSQPVLIQLCDEFYAVVGNKDQLLNLEPSEAHVETHVSEYDAGAPVAIENEPAPPLTLQPDRPNSATSTDVLGPAMSGQINPLDVTGIKDPAGFDINTDVTGDVGF